MHSPQQSFSIESIKNPELTIEKLQQLLRHDDAMRAIFAENTYYIKEHAAFDSVLELCFSGMCGTYTPRLVKYLAEQGVKSVAATSSDVEGEYHVYAALFAGNDLLIVDPSIGQYIKGYRDIFIGSRTELQKLILSEDTAIHYSNMERTRLFEKVWGNSSVTAYPPSKKPISEIA